MKLEAPSKELPGRSRLGYPRRATVLTCVVVLGLACLGAGFLALISSGAIGGTAMGVAPQVTFKLVEPVICPSGTVLEYTSIHRSYHQPGESEPHLECVSGDGSRQDVLGGAILSVLAMVFAVTWLFSFVGISIPVGVAALLVVRWFRRRKFDLPG